MKKIKRHEENQNGEEGPGQFQVIADNVERLKRDFADDLDQLRGTIDKLWDVLSDQHEINQCLTDRLFILENHIEMNADKSASIH